MVVTVGFFDGVHLGHRKVLNTLLEKGSESAVVTFWPHPRVVLQHDARELCLLNSMDEKQDWMRSLGVKNVRCLEFSRDFANISARDFIKDYLVRDMGCTSLVLGYNNRLGGDSCSTEQIMQLCSEFGINVEIVPSVVLNDVAVSSTIIRQAIQEDGDVAFAAKLLGYNYPIVGIVVPGNRIGRTIGYPTANVRPIFPLKAIPSNGVYVTEVQVHGDKYLGMTNIGVRPTLGEGGQKLIETNIFDFDEDIYGMEIKLSFIARIREEKKFESIEMLRRQLDIDRHRCYGYI